MDDSPSLSTDGARVAAFLAGDGRDDRGRALCEILAWDDVALEGVHDFIQWLFPLAERSGANPGAPVPTRDDFARMARDARVLAGVDAALARMLAFYGLRQQAADAARTPAIVRAANWPERSADWLPVATHNDLRITRMLKSLRLFGRHAQARALLHFLEPAAQAMPQRATALRYWRDALRED